MHIYGNVCDNINDSYSKYMNSSEEGKDAINEEYMRNPIGGLSYLVYSRNEDKRFSLVYIFTYMTDAYENEWLSITAIPIDKIVNSNISKLSNDNLLLLNMDRDNVVLYYDKGDDSPDDRLYFGENSKSINWLSYFTSGTPSPDKVTIEGKVYKGFSIKIDPSLELYLLVPTEDLYSEATNIAIINFASIVIISLLVFAILFLLFKYFFIKPIEKLSHAASQFSPSNLELDVSLRNDDEIKNLEMSIRDMLDSIKNSNQRLKIATIAQSKMDAEIQLAKDVQFSLFPPYIVLDKVPNSTLQIRSYLEIEEGVGGDFIGCIQIDEDNISLCIGDVAGKGLPAALYAVMVQTIIAAEKQNLTHPAKVLDVLNKRILEKNKNMFFASLILCTLNLKTGELRYSNAGHNPPLIGRSGQEVAEMNIKSNFVVGVVNDIKYEEESIILGKNDSFIMYTDGITEAMNTRGDRIGLKRVLSSINTVPSDLDSILFNVKTELKKHRGENTERDDSTLLAIKYMPKNPSEEREIVVDAEIKNYISVYDFLASFMDEKNIPQSIRHKIYIAVEEIFVNISNYAYKEHELYKKVSISVSIGSRIIRVIFADSGEKFNPWADAPELDISQPFDKRSVGGLGIHIVKNLMDDFSYEYISRTNILYFEKLYADE
jgi:sigma-B regulation protein RsbU (phosphoserine phosphatase)